MSGSIPALLALAALLQQGAEASRPNSAHLTPAESLARLDSAADLRVELVLSEPEVRQPISISFDERGRLWVVEYAQYPNPAGLKALSRDEYLRTVYDQVPPPPPHHFQGADRISIHADTDGDGRFDSHKTFVEGLSIVTSCARGSGGVWVLNPPYLLFYPDRDDDDVPDGDPEVRLAGFGLEDTHSVVNSLKFGPDGWLYAAQGSTVSAHVTVPGVKAEPVHSAGQLMWRYHPESRRYEVFAEGGGNAFCVEFDAQGRLFSGHNGQDARGFHYAQGGYFQKTFQKHGPLSNPYAFGWLPPMPHQKSPRFTHAFSIYEGDTFPAKYRGQLFAIETLFGRIVRAERLADGSTFRTRDLDHPLESRDDWFRPVDIQLGPDGALYIADFHEARIDHLAHHRGELARDTGRVYRLQAKDAPPLATFDLRRKSSDELAELLVTHPNRWFRQSALRLLGERRDGAALPRLIAALRDRRGQPALEALWAIHQIAGLDESLTLAALDHRDPHVRRWATRLAGDERRVSSAVAKKLAEIAATDPDAELRSQLASTARRLPPGDGLPIIRALLSRTADADDPRLPLLLWWGIEAHATAAREQALELFADRSVWSEPLVRRHVLERIMRRFARGGSRAELLACARLFDLSPDAEARKLLLAGFERAFEGREMPALPDELVQALGDAGGSLVLGVRRGDADAVAKALATIADADAPLAERLRLVRTFGEVDRPSSVATLSNLIGGGETQLAQAALSSLGRYGDERIPARVLAEFPRMPAVERSAAISLLASRAPFAHELLAAIDAGTVTADAVDSDAVLRMSRHADPRLKKAVLRHWRSAGGASSEELATQVAQQLAQFEEGTGDPYAGRPLFEASCAKCHRLFDEGGTIGPDLTGYRRDDVRGLVASVIDPSAEIREGFATQLAVTIDGRLVSGFLVERDERVVTLRGADGRDITLRRDEIDEMRAQKQSLMPEGLLRGYTPQQARDLFAYLRISQPLNRKRPSAIAPPTAPPDRKPSP
ncbi:MAG: PVC-type heme-binding CxxCH protein [Planctomycetaceae bacterium]